MYIQNMRPLQTTAQQIIMFPSAFSHSVTPHSYVYSEVSRPLTFNILTHGLFHVGCFMFTKVR